jgi:hypothetical protein
MVLQAAVPQLGGRITPEKENIVKHLIAVAAAIAVAPLAFFMPSAAPAAHAATGLAATADSLTGCTYDLAIRDTTIPRTQVDWLGLRSADNEPDNVAGSSVISGKVGQWAVCTDSQTGDQVLWNATTGFFVLTSSLTGSLHDALRDTSPTVGPQEQFVVKAVTGGCTIQSAFNGAFVRANTNYNSIEYAASGVSDVFRTDDPQVCG